MRDAARDAKMRALRTLAAHLEQFESRLVRERRARPLGRRRPRTRNRLVRRDRPRGTGVKRIVKNKSMVTEETHLNDALLERAGLTVVETDLGEYIVQLGNDRPSHIIAPIIHLTRQDVGQLMHRRLNVPYTDDAKALAAVARMKLREEFLTADMGLSGANFGVADTGTICLVTNEGNGRMVTTLPRVHVAVMGIEKLVPTLADLDVCLKVLARSGTGQKLTRVCTDDGDGAAADGRDRRPRGTARHPPRQRAHGYPRRRHRRNSRLHPLRGVPQRVPRVSQHRRSRVRRHVSLVRSARW